MQNADLEEVPFQIKEKPETMNQMRNSKAERNDTFLSIYEKESVIIVPTSYTEIKREIEYLMSNILTRIQLNTEQNKEKILGSYQNVIKG